jgi:O-succinylbenzoic acid--CoA ligase
VTLSIFDAARAEPTRLAVIDREREVSYAELATRVARRLRELSAAGALDARGEPPVAVVARPTLATVETLLALFAVGTPALLLHARASEREHAALTEHAGAVPEPPAAQEPPGLLDAGAGGAVPEPALTPFDAERIAALVATSGSTGAPRLARLSHRALLAAAAGFTQHIGVEDERWLLALPLAHIGGLGILVRALGTRRTVVLFAPERSLLGELGALARVIERHAVTLVSLVPTLLARLLEAPIAWRPPPSLRLVLLGGAPIPRELVVRARTNGIPVIPTYGMTETCAAATLGRYGDRLDMNPPPGELLPSGVPLTGVELRSEDGVIGLRGPTLFSGYLGDAASDPRGGWFMTCDRGSFDERGELIVTGRTTDVIITGGENVDPAAVEAALLSVPGVRLACVIGHADATFGELVTALLVIGADGPRSAAELAEPLAHRLAPHQRPRRVEIVPELPLTPAGKVDRRAARSLYGAKI